MSDDLLNALREMLAPTPPTRVVETPTLPPVRESVCAKCPFGGARLTTVERAQAEGIKAKVAARMATGETVIWGCHATMDKGPRICRGFAEWRPDQ